MGLVSTWLSGIGLSNAVPTFQLAGIVTPENLAELDVSHFEALGINNPDDRRKLFYLVQRIKMAVNKDKNKADDSVEKQVDAVISSTSDMQEEKKEDHIVTKSSAASNRTTKKASPVKKKVQSTLKTPVRRSRRLASQDEEESSTATDQRKGNENSSPTKSQKSASSTSPPKTLQSGKMAPTKILSSPQKSLSSNRLLSPKVRVEKRQEDDENKYREGVTTTSPNKANTRKIMARTAASKRAGEVFNLRDDEADIKAATSAAPPAKSSSPHKDPKKASPVVTAIEPNPQKTFKLQNPGKSMRTGKRLSVIPAEEEAPMSPLVNPRHSQPQSETSISHKGRHSRQNSASSQGSRGSTALGSVDEESDDQASALSGSSRSTTASTRRPRNSMGAVGKSNSRRFSAAAVSDLSASTNTSDRRKTVDPTSSLSKAVPFVHGGSQAESWSTQVENLREDNNAEYELFRNSEEQEVYQYDMRIRVIVRKRPVSKAEASLSGGIDVIHPLDYGDHGKVLVYQPKTRVDLTKEIETIPFAYDDVYDDTSTNLQIYQRSLRNLIRPFFMGQWSTVFAYGQTGSGKTYTMMGSSMTGINAGTAKLDEKNLGLYYLAALDIFEMVEQPEYQHLTVQVSLFEIYGGKLFDLLNGRRQVKCLEDSKGKVCFPGLTEHPVGGPDELMCLIEEGATNRSTGTTSRNADSSRSHAVLQLKLRKDIGRKKNVEHGRLNFIDLAGSERGADTSNASRATRLEGAEINTSLLALKEVIRALATGGSMNHIPFRGSKLTQVLKDSFVGKNSRCCMVACVSPDIGNCEQTLNTLRYADRVKERDAETGALANGYDQPTRLHKLDVSATGLAESMFDDGRDLPAPSSNDYEEDEDLTLKQITTGTSAVDALMVPTLDETTTERSKQNKTVQPVVSVKEKAGENLILTHRSVMSSLLSMVKDEMMLANEVDANRDGLDDYLVKLETMQNTQLDLISKLRTSLSHYVSACENPGEAMLATVASDEESFEDLRD